MGDYPKISFNFRYHPISQVMPGEQQFLMFADGGEKPKVLLDEVLRAPRSLKYNGM